MTKINDAMAMSSSEEETDSDEDSDTSIKPKDLNEVGPGHNKDITVAPEILDNSIQNLKPGRLFRNIFLSFNKNIRKILHPNQLKSLFIAIWSLFV